MACEVVRLLLEASSPVEPVDFFLRSPLHYAAHAGEAAIVEQLLGDTDKSNI